MLRLQIGGEIAPNAEDFAILNDPGMSCPPKAVETMPAAPRHAIQG